jgi:hypothetical protein
MSSEGFSALDKNDVICRQRAVLPIPLGTTACCRLKWPFGALFFLNLNFQGPAWEPLQTTQYNGCLAIFKFLKKCANGNYYRQRTAKPDQITQQNRLQQAGGP